VLRIKEVAIRRDDNGDGWQTLIVVEAQFGTIEPHFFTMVVPQDEPSKSSEDALAVARGYVRKVFAELAPDIE